MTEVKEITQATHFGQCLAHRKQLLDASYYYPSSSDFYYSPYDQMDCTG